MSYPVFENAYCVHRVNYLLIVYSFNKSYSHNLRKASWGIEKGG